MKTNWGCPSWKLGFPTGNSIKLSSFKLVLELIFKLLSKLELNTELMLLIELILEDLENEISGVLL